MLFFEEGDFNTTGSAKVNTAELRKLVAERCKVSRLFRELAPFGSKQGVYEIFLARCLAAIAEHHVTLQCLGE